jgi:hypothetical protein
LPDSQLRVLGKEYFGDKDLVRRKITRRDCLAVFDPLLRVNQNRGRFFYDGVIVGPLRQDLSRGIHQINFDPLIRRKVERYGAPGQICQCHLDSKLADLRQLYRLRRDLEIESEPTQSCIFILPNRIGRKWMEEAAQPTASARRCCRGRRILAKGALSDKKCQKEQDNVAFHERVKQQTLQILSNPLSIGMKTLCAFAICLVFAAAGGVAKQRHCMFRVHTQANPQDTNVFATSVRAQLSGKNVAIEKIPRISEQDVIAFYPYPAANGTYGALFQLDEHGRIALDSLSIERKGSLLFVFINGRLITELEIDKRVSDGKIYIASGLAAADIDLMKKDWRLIGQQKR